MHLVWGASDQGGEAAALAEREQDADPVLTVETVDFQGLKKELARLTMRQLKKVAKADQRLRKADEEAAGGKDDFEEDATPAVLKVGLELEARRMEKLTDLEALVLGMKNTKDPGLPAALELANELGVSDKKPQTAPRGPKKPKGQQPAPRKPYVVYEAADGTEVWVGRKAEDNDELTTRLRDPANWWLHAAGCPGSHVVIRTVDESVPTEVVKDAACLALHFSQAPGGRQKISLTRCRDVSKPSGYPAGRVLLRGEVTTIKMNLKEQAKRLDRLLATKRLG